MPRRAAAGVAAVVALLAPACSGGGGDDRASPASSVPAPVTSFSTLVLAPGPTVLPTGPGEPEAWTRLAPPAPTGARTRDVTLTIDTTSWSDETGYGYFAAWAPSAGLFDTVEGGAGVSSVPLRGRLEPGEPLEIWIADLTGLPVRRLYVATAPDGDLRLAPADPSLSIAQMLAAAPTAPSGFLVAA